MTHYYLIAYDIADPKRLNKVRKIAYSYALGGQKSAVEAPLTQKDLKILVARLLKVMRKEDKVNIIMVEEEPLLFGKADFIKYDKGLILI
jgi:CRISPR-associated endonuclease Cas2